MRKLFVLLCVSVYVFGFEISFNKKFIQYVNPDKLSTNVTINVLKDDEIDISPILNKFNKLITTNDKIEKRGGIFSISPKYKYKNGNSKIIGYSGSLRYSIFSTNSDDINEFIKTILNLKEDDDTSISISSLNWIVSDVKYSNAIEDLRLKAIIWSKEYASILSNNMKTSCKVKAVNIDRNHLKPAYRSMTAMKTLGMSMNSSIPVPEQTKNSVSINPTYLMECK